MHNKHAVTSWQWLSVTRRRESGKGAGGNGRTNQSFINVLLKNLPSLAPSFSELIQDWTVSNPFIQQSSAAAVPTLLCTLPPKWGSNGLTSVGTASNHPPVLSSLPAQVLPMQNSWWDIAWPQSAAEQENKKTGRGKVLAHLSYLLGSTSRVPVFNRVLSISWESRTF